MARILMTESLTTQEKDDMRQVLSKLYGAQTQEWQINIKTFELLGVLIEKTKSCSHIMDLVPRPFGGGSIVNWGKRQVRDVILRQLKNRKEDDSYIICLKVSAASMKIKFIHAGLGL